MSPTAPAPTAAALHGVVQNYAWGSPSAIAELLGVEPTGDPQAELWLGAHERGPGTLAGGGRLDEMISADPHGHLGSTLATEFDGRLPFLFKVLAAGQPLSIQAHPSRPEAIAGFEREEAAGVAIDAADRSFRDANHKPELICALTEFVALCGFRELAATKRLLDGLEVPGLVGLFEPDDSTPDPPAVDDAGPLAEALRRLLTMETAEAALLATEVTAACAQDLGPDEFASERREVAGLAETYPGDRGLVVALLLHLVVLEPGQALFLGAGNLHGYIRGTGVEIMANSDNVLRGGLTPKHIDIPTLLDVVDATPYDLTVGVQDPSLVNGVATYDCPVPDFNLARVAVGPERDSVALRGDRPQILLCTEGVLVVATIGGAPSSTEPIEVERGGSVWIPASVSSIVIGGNGEGFVASADPAESGG